ncbi:type II toxin-antitoxin system HicA family toxin [Aeoliella mucimassa]|uniref:YcfA-like protein n=1 Tax=Aeoliella mucimassa TaxID=2527972 RepID=A0A518AIR9_9BACT|nr:type II toxin-antitoxin system HicA family toxin [Aeoliella mucimassa]QDU54622.1 YcfA-like protein [Aeoliella mucimassa]
MSKQLPVLSSREVIKALEKSGFYTIPNRGKGSHVFLYRDDPPKGITIPNNRELKRGTLRAIIRQADLTVEEFLALL